MRTARFNIYAYIHKALRASMHSVLAAVGRMDPYDDDEVMRTTAEVLALLESCRSHVAHEDRFIHPAMQARHPGSADIGHAEHVAHRNDIAALTDAVAAVQGRRGEARVAATAALYRTLALFVAHNLEHMDMEETVHNAVLWAHYSDDELHALERALIASIPPATLMQVLRAMIPSVAPAERASLLAGLQRGAPAPVFDAVLSIAREELDGRNWNKLMAALAPMPAVA